jgi:hypothetical protein
MSDGLRNELKITVDSTGATSGAGGGASDAVPWAVSRRGQLDVSPFQGVSNFAGNRQLQFSNEIAMEISRDRKLAREFESSRWKRQVRHEAGEIASAVRASEERIRRRDNLATAVRADQFDDIFDDGRRPGALRRRTTAAAKTSAKRILRGWGTGAIAGFASTAALPVGEQEGAAGAFGRLLISTVSGGAWGGAPGAVGAFITQAISEMMRALSEGSKEIEDLRKLIAAFRKELEQMFKDAQRELLFSQLQSETAIKKAVEDIATEAETGYRENRYQQSGLVD